MLRKTLIVLLPLAILAGGWFFIHTKNADDTAQAVVATDTEISQDTNNNVFAPAKQADTIQVEANTSTTETAVASPTTSSTNESELSTSKAQIDATTVALTPLSDEEFIDLEKMMKTDKSLRLNLLEEYRYNTDPTRAKQLAALLASYKDPEIVQVASELAYSGDLQSQRAGLYLLERIQPHNNQARDIAIDLLSSEGNSELLVATMNVLAKPSRQATPDQRQLLSDNLNNLSYHQDARVRAHSLSLIGRWDKNSPLSQQALTRGLTDSDPMVRSRATFAIKNIPNPNEEIVNGLLAIAEDTNNEKPTRYAALAALAKISLSDLSLQRYNEAKVNVNRRVIRK